MAGKKEWRLEVDLNSQLTKHVGVSREYLNSLKPEDKKEHASEYNKVLQILDKLETTAATINSGSGNDFRSALTSLRELNNAMITLAQVSHKLTKEQEKAAKAVAEAGSIADERRKVVESLKAGKVKRGDEYQPTIENFTKLYNEQFKSKTVGLNSNKPDATITYNTFMKKMKDEQWVQNNKEIANAFNNWKSKVIKKITDEINAATNSVIEAEQKVEQLDAEYKKLESSIPGSTGLSKVFESSKEVRFNISQAEKSRQDFKTAQLTELDDAYIQRLTTSITKQQSALGKAFKQFTLYAVALRTAKQAARMAINTISELDKSLTEQAMVTGKTRDQTYSYLKSYQDLAATIGSTTKEVASVTTEYMKQGETFENSLILSKAAISAAKVARVSVGDSVNYLTTALKGFQMEADQAMSISDKFAKLAAASATDYDELAIALSKVASQAHNAGMSMDYTLALLTKGLETTRKYFAA